MKRSEGFAPQGQQSSKLLTVHPREGQDAFMDLHVASFEWLKTQAIPLWTTKGVNPRGGFEEALTLTGVPHALPRRAMVQARQIYAVRTAREMGLLSPEKSRTLIAETTAFLLRHYGRDDGSFIHSVRPDLEVNSARPDLYTQSFAIFGLAHAYAVLGDKTLKERALAVVAYLQRERRGPHNGYTEIDTEGRAQYQSNPHMHLFEAFVSWLEVDDDPRWRHLANAILDLALTRFMHPQTKLLAEYFDESWSPQTTHDRFVWEPGHQYEWAWLMNKYQHLSKIDLADPIATLVMNAERFGVDPHTGAVRDEIWSDFSVKAPTARFWPQCERIKACAALGLSDSADQAMTSLLGFFVTPTPGLWFDRMNPDGSFHQEPARASSLYHIIGAMAEYRGLA